MNFENIFEAVKRQMEASLEAVRYAITHAGVKGAINEDVVKNFLRSYLPDNLGIDSGFLVDSNGNISKQLDIIIFDARKTPCFFMATSIRVIPIECAYAVIEVKTDLNSGSLKECIANMRSVKSLEKKAYYEDTLITFGHRLYDKEYENWPVLYFIFAFQSIPLKSIASALKADLNNDPIDKRIDSVFSLEKGFLGHASNGGIDAIPSLNSQYICVEHNHLLIFYALLSKYMNQVKMKNFNFTPYIAHLNFQVKSCE